MEGFFSPSEVASRAPATMIPRCGVCRLHLRCKSPKMPVAGNGKRRILVVGEGPGVTEDREGRPFVGKSGRFLQNALKRYDIDLFRDCWVTNALICWPHEDGKNRTPTDKEISHCRPNVLNAIRVLDPDVVLLLGKPAVQSVIGSFWSGSLGEMNRWVGWRIPLQLYNCWVCPAWHPSFVMREENGRQNSVKELLWHKHLAAVAELSDKPWRKVPDYDSKVTLLFNHDEVPKYIDRFIENGRVVAWDLECDRLKPDHPDATIVCCSVSDGKTTISYPWHGEAVEATKRLLLSPIPKVGQNIKYEERWAMSKMKISVNGTWAFDDMLAAHVLDNREGTTGLEFQELVTLGVTDHKKGIKPYLQSAHPGGNEPNRIRELDLKTLLKYNALDSLIEYKIAKIQARELGIDLENPW